MDQGVGFEHAFSAAKIESAFTRAVAQVRGKRRIIEKTSERSSKGRGVTGTEGEADVTKNLGERAKIRSDNRQGPQHVFCDNQAKNFSTQRRHDDSGGPRDRNIQLRSVETAGEVHL